MVVGMEARTTLPLSPLSVSLPSFCLSFAAILSLFVSLSYSPTAAASLSSVKPVNRTEEAVGQRTKIEAREGDDEHKHGILGDVDVHVNAEYLMGCQKQSL